MSRRRRRAGSGISLFAFQDIITCVMGIMLLLTLMLCLQISTAAVREFTPEDTVTETLAQVEALQQQIERLSENVNQQQALLNSGAIEDVELLRQQAEQMSNDSERALAALNEAEQSALQSAASLQKLQQTAAERKDQVSTTQKLLQQVKDMEAQLQKIQSGDRIIYNGHDSQSKRCWLVEMNSTNEFVAAELGRTMTPQKFSSLSQLSQWMSADSSRSFLLIVKPDSADVFDGLKQELRQKKVTFGFDLLPTGKVAIDPVTGAGTE